MGIGGAVHRWLYRGGRPNALAMFINSAWARLHARGIAPEWLVTLEVAGRNSGAIRRFPLVMARVYGQRYLVCMLGGNTQWVKNVRAAGGLAVLRRGVREKVRLVEIAPEGRAVILKAYLQRAPGARPHFPIGPDAPIEAFERLAASYPVFKVEPWT